MTVDDSATRARLVRAAIDCILEEGYYRASSNRIAARAGVTWGVIQYYFGTREQLLLAVVHDSTDQLVASLTNAEITGDTTIERIGSLADVVWANYGRPEFVARMQIVLDLSRDPRTADETLDALAAVEKRITGVWERLMSQAVPSEDRKLAAAVFGILRGVAIGETLMEQFAPRRRRPYGANERDTVVRALALLVDE